MTRRLLRIAVAGAGGFGREHLRIASQIAGVTLVGVADVRSKAAEAAAQEFGAAGAFTDSVEMIERLRPDGLIVATPGHTHVPIACAALEHGIPVLLEKPVGLSAADADTLIHVESRSLAFVLPGHILRFCAPYGALRDIVRSGELGRVLSFTARNHRDETHATRYPDLDPVLMTMVHEIDMALWITGGVLETVLALRRPHGTSRSETLVTGSDSSGAMWHISNAWTVPNTGWPPDRLEVVCERGSVEMELGGAIRVFGDTPRTVDISAAHDDDMLRAEIKYFLSCMENGASPEIVTLQDARNGLAAADAVLRSLRKGGLERV